MMNAVKPLIVLPILYLLFDNSIELMYKFILEVLEELTAVLYLHQFTEKLHDFSPPQTVK